MSVFENGKTYALFVSPANKKIIGELEKSGANFILFPAVETEEIVINSENENLLKNLSEFDWIVFQNIYAVDYLLNALASLEIDFFELDALRICAFGETVADRLRYSQVHSDIISNSLDTSEILRALRDYEPEFESLKYLIPVEDNRNSEIAESLAKTGVRVTEIPFYQTKISRSANLPKLKALLKGGAIDEFIFISPIDATNLAILFHPEKLSESLSDVMVSATDSTTFQSLREFGITRIIMR